MRRQAIEAALEQLDQLESKRDLGENLVQPIRAKLRDRLIHVERSGDGDDGRKEFTKLHDEIELLLIAAERPQTNDLFCNSKLTDEARRRIERELDLRETYLMNKRRPPRR